MSRSRADFRRVRCTVVRRFERDELDDQQQRLAEALLARLVALAALADHRVLSGAASVTEERHA